MFNDTLAGLEAYMDETMRELDPANEGLFGLGGPKPVEKLLNTVKKNIDKRCKTVEDCDDMLAKIKEEEAKFNENLGIMATARKKYDAGELDKKGLAAAVTPCIKELKKTCQMLKLSDFVKNNNDITEAELANLKAFIVGARDLIRAKKTEITVGGTAKGVASESFYSDLIDDEDEWDDAYESIGGFLKSDVVSATMKTVNGNIDQGSNRKMLNYVYDKYRKQAKPVLKQAKKAQKAKNYDEAIALLKNVLKIYDAGVAEIRKLSPDAAKKVETAFKFTRSAYVYDKLTGQWTLGKISTDEKNKMDPGTWMFGSNMAKVKVTIDKLTVKKNLNEQKLKDKAVESFLIDDDEDFAFESDMDETFDELLEDNEFDDYASEGVSGTARKRAALSGVEDADKIINPIYKDKSNLAKPVIKNAKQAAKKKDYAEAIKLYKEARKIFESGVKEIGKANSALAKKIEIIRKSGFGKWKKETSTVASAAEDTFARRLAQCDEAIAKLEEKMKASAASESEIALFMCELDLAMESFEDSYDYDSDYDGIDDDDFDIED